jgi:hypothetical protein
MAAATAAARAGRAADMTAVETTVVVATVSCRE